MYKLKIRNLHCNSCIKKIEETVKKLDFTSTTSGNLEDSLIIIKSKESEKKIRNSIKEAGFEIITS